MKASISLNFGFVGEVPTPQIQLNLYSDISKVFPRHTYRVDTDLNMGANGVIEGPPPGQLQSKCFLVFIGGQYLDQLGEVMEKVKSVGKAVRMGAPYAVFIMKSVNTINLDPALFEGPKYSPELNKKWEKGSLQIFGTVHKKMHIYLKWLKYRLKIIQFFLFLYCN